jgi:hypothetical protein
MDSIMLESRCSVRVSLMIWGCITYDVLNMFLQFMFDFIPHILYDIKIRTQDWPFDAMLISFFHILLHYACPLYGGIIILKHIIVIWEMMCKNQT